MDNYKQLALRYLQLNKNRSIITVIGTAITVTVLFALLNIGWSGVLYLRTTLRQEQDYEVVFMTETKEQIEQIVEDSRVKNASVGSFYYYDYYEPKTYGNAVYVNFMNPYQMEKVATEISEKTNVAFDYNLELAITYMQGAEDFMGVIVCCFILLISFIFAVFGVGIVRNSIQLCTLEQIKDYGNLRCVGSTKSQLKAIIYLEGAILETIGIVIGLLVGFVVSMIAGAILGVDVSFHFLPVIPVLIAFFGDLYFVMEESCKVVTNMTPVSAIRGEYRIKREKIKRRHSGLIGKMFGIEGDYAYKNMMRNPGRFLKTTGAISIGIAAFIATLGIGNTFAYLEQDMEKSFGYYHMYLDAGYIAPTQAVEGVKSAMSSEIFEKMKNLPGIIEAKQVYCAQVLFSDWRDVYSHYNSDYIQYIWNGEHLKELNEKFDKVMGDTSGNTKDSKKSAYISTLAGVRVYGYDEEDMKRYKDVLVDGTLDVSENGILIMNHCKTAKEEFDEDLDGLDMVDVDFTNYKVGDTIDIVNTAKFRELFLERIAPVNEEYKDVYKMYTESSMASGTGDEMIFEDGVQDTESQKEQEALQERYDEYIQEKAKVYTECYDEIVKRGDYETYTVEGILNGDVNRSAFEGLEIIVPLKQYYKLSGTNEGDSIGMQYHFKNFPVLKYNNEIGISGGSAWNFVGERDGYNASLYPEFRGLLTEFKGTIIGLIAFVLFVVLISCINIINTTASNIHLRRQEFAQLRVIGVSQKGLVKMVLLEGVISSLLANAVGIVIGLTVSYGLFRTVVTILYGFKYQTPWMGVLISVVVSTLVLCGSIYLPLRKLDNNIADSLKTSGE